MNLKEIKHQLPHGSIIEIAKRTELSPSTISLFFRGKLKVMDSVKIIRTAADVIKESKEKEREAIAYLKEAIEY